VFPNISGLFHEFNKNYSFAGLVKLILLQNTKIAKKFDHAKLAKHGSICAKFGVLQNYVTSFVENPSLEIYPTSLTASENIVSDLEWGGGRVSIKKCF
jgi:hypothetical protein